MKALITGANSKLALALGQGLKDRGYDLLLTSRTDMDTSDPFRKVDLTKDLSPLVSWIHEECPDLIINNAGAGLYGPALNHKIKEQLDLLKLNGNAMLELTLEGALMMKIKKKPGTILNIGSVAGTFPYPSFSIYSASKQFMSSVSQSLDFEMRPYGIRVLVACIGQMATSFRKKASKGYFDQNTPLILPIDIVVKKLLKQIEQKKHYVVIDWRYKILLNILKSLPEILRNKILLKSIKDRYR